MTLDSYFAATVVNANLPGLPSATQPGFVLSTPAVGAVCPIAGEIDPNDPNNNQLAVGADSGDAVGANESVEACKPVT